MHSFNLPAEQRFDGDFIERERAARAAGWALYVGEFNIDRGKVKHDPGALHWAAPPSRSLHRLHTAAPAMLPPSFAATAFAQLPPNAAQ